MSENKTGKYLKYAIGEIFLVIIGILIALQINNWNETRNSQKRIDDQLEKVYEELEMNLWRTNFIMNWHKRTTPYIYKTLKKELTRLDLKKDPGYYLFPYSYHAVDLMDNAILQLESSENQLASKQYELFNELIKIYKFSKPKLDRTDEGMRNISNEMFDKLRVSKPWAHQLFLGDEPTEEMYEYFLNDPYYINDILSLNADRGDHIDYVLFFKNNGTEVYEKLAEYLGRETDTVLIPKDLNYKDYVGTYVFNSDTLKITLKDEKLEYKYSSNNRTDSNTFHIVSKKEFYLFRGFGTVKRDENNDIIGFDYMTSRVKKNYIKIE